MTAKKGRTFRTLVSTLIARAKDAAFAGAQPPEAREGIRNDLERAKENVINHWRDRQDSANSEIERLRQRETDLLDANNRYLDRARKAEGEVERLRQAASNMLPYLRWTVGDESPGHHPTMFSALSAFELAFGFVGKSQAQIARSALEKRHD